MSLGRLIGILLALAIGWWIVAKSGLILKPENGADTSRAPIERARDAARQSAEREAQHSATRNEAEAPGSGGAITENMTPDQVRALLGSPTQVESETAESGARREKWIYSSVGKTVVFENGVVTAVQ